MARQGADGSTVTYTEEITGVPAKYVLGAAVGAVGLVMLLRSRKNGKPSLFRQYVMPLILAAAYKKIISTVEKSLQSKDAEMPVQRNMQTEPAHSY